MKSLEHPKINNFWSLSLDPDKTVQDKREQNKSLVHKGAVTKIVLDWVSNRGVCTDACLLSDVSCSFLLHDKALHLIYVP